MLVNPLTAHIQLVGDLFVGKTTYDTNKNISLTTCQSSFALHPSFDRSQVKPLGLFNILCLDVAVS